MTSQLFRVRPQLPHYERSIHEPFAADISGPAPKASASLQPESRRETAYTGPASAIICGCLSMIRWLPASPGSLTGGKNRDREFLKTRELPLKEEPQTFEMIPLIHGADGGEPTVNIRDLHAYMKVGKDFST